MKSKSAEKTKAQTGLIGRKNARKPDHLRKNMRINVRISQSDYEQLQRLAGPKSVHKYVRDSIIPKIIEEKGCA